MKELCWEALLMLNGVFSLLITVLMMFYWGASVLLTFAVTFLGVAQSQSAPFHVGWSVPFFTITLLLSAMWFCKAWGIARGRR